MRVLLHAHGGPTTGAGHVVRSVALAEAALSAGHEVALTGTIEGSFLEGLLAGAGVTLAGPEVARKWSPDVVHLDSYADACSRFLAEPPPGTRLTSNMEDGPFGRRPESTLRLDPSPGPPRASIDQGRTVVAGLDLAPIRSAVVARRGSWRPSPAGRCTVLVMMGGGGDPGALADRALAALVGGEVGQVTVVGAREVVAPAGLDVRARRHEDDVAALMAAHDLLVTAAGTSMWEACCVGVPMAVVRAVDNQAAGYAWVTDHGAAEGLDTDPGTARGRLHALLRDGERRAAMAARAGTLVDGHGAWRVVRIWEQLLSVTGGAGAPARRVSLRPATDDDADLLRAWRNDPVTRASSRGTQPVSEQEHRAWLASSLQRDDRLLLVAEDGASPVGTVRWDRVGQGVWEVSITIDPAHRGRGMAEPVLRAAEVELGERRSQVHALLAVVHEDNAASRRLFTRAGYLAHQPPDGAGFASYRRVLS